LRKTLCRCQVGPASEAEVERLELFRSIKEQRRPIVAVAGDDGKVASQERGSCALEAVEWATFGHGQEPLRRFEVPGLEARLRRGQRTPGLEGRVRGQRGRPLQECRAGRDAAAALRSCCGAFQFGGHGLVRFGSREGAMPGAAVGGELGIAHLRQRVVHTPSLVERRGSVHR
jgi:hypothetical protein